MFGADLPVTRKLLQALVADWDVAPAGSEGQLTDQARRDIEAAESYFGNGSEGIPHQGRSQRVRFDLMPYFV